MESSFFSCLDKRGYKGSRADFLIIFVLFSMLVHRRLSQTPFKMRDQQTPLFNLSSYQLWFSLLVQQDCLFYWSCHIILSRLWIAHSERSLIRPFSPMWKKLNLANWLQPTSDSRASCVSLSINRNQLTASSESLWNFSLKGYLSPDGLALLYQFGRLVSSCKQLLCLVGFVCWGSISRTGLEICPNPAHCEPDINQWTNIRNAITVVWSW